MDYEEISALLEELIEAAKRCVRAKSYDDWATAEKRVTEIKQRLMLAYNNGTANKYDFSGKGDTGGY